MKTVHLDPSKLLGFHAVRPAGPDDSRKQPTKVMPARKGMKAGMKAGTKMGMKLGIKST